VTQDNVPTVPFPHKRHRTQKWRLGQKVRITKPMPPLGGVPLKRLTAVGVISRVTMQFPSTPDMAQIIYWVSLRSELLSVREIGVCPGKDLLTVELLD